MKIISLYGRGNCGKSDTLGLHLRSMILRALQMPPMAEPIRNKDKDARAVYDVGGWRVVLCPEGDAEWIVEKNIHYLEQHPSDIVFTSTRTRGVGRERLVAYARQACIPLTEMAKPYNDGLNPSDQSEANCQLAELLFCNFLTIPEH